MKTSILLLRGINVGGKNSLSMAELVSLIESLGAREVKTYIQSGNAVFNGDDQARLNISRKLPALIDRVKGFKPQVMVLDAITFRNIVTNNPYPISEQADNTQHIGFLGEQPGKPDLARLNALKAPSEQFYLTQEAFYLFAPDGVGKSKLAAGAEKAIGVPLTFRNWKTSCKIRELASV